MNRLRNVTLRAPLVGNIRVAMRTSRSIAIWKRLQHTQSTSLRPFSIHYSRPRTLSYPASGFLRDDFGFISPSSVRTFHHSFRVAKENEANTQSRTEPPKAESATEETAKQASGEESPSGEESTEYEKSEGKKEEEKKEDPPPPPPHGDKSPWQVFTETLQSEFKASKEWNESTKALAAGAQQFTENESVRRARQAYESTTGAVSTTAGNVLKTTAGAVGKGAAWTWETPVVKGVRSTVNATASVIEKGTRPIRETEAYKNVKEVIDDGSSSRYGGWVEKEDRRKARELREIRQAQAGGGRPIKPAEEDPKSVDLYLRMNLHITLTLTELARMLRSTKTLPGKNPGVSSAIRAK